MYRIMYQNTLSGVVRTKRVPQQNYPVLPSLLFICTLINSHTILQLRRGH
jgi:hypothetical protein